MKLLVEIAWTHVTTRIRQTLVGILGVAMGVGFTIMIAGLMEGGQRDFIRQLVDTLPHVTVSDERRASSAQPAEREYAAVQVTNMPSAERRTGIKNPGAVVASIESWLPGAVSPSQQTTALAHFSGGHVGITVTGIDPRREAKVSKLASQMQQGTLNDLFRASNAVIIGEALAQKIGAQTRSAITISAGESRVITATVVGIFRSGVHQIDESQVYTLLRTAQVLSGQPGGVNQLRLRLDDAVAATNIAAQVEMQTGYKSVSWQEANANLLSAFTVRMFMMLIVMAAMLFSSCFATYNIISTITHEKRHDIAIMKSLGMKEPFVRGIFILEAAMMGAVGVLGGWVIGYLLCISLSQITFFNPLSGETIHVPIYWTMKHYLGTGLFSLVACAAAAYFPARKATRVHPVEIIRGAA
jgi:lipoprotein-releasing system permease protein